MFHGHTGPVYKVKCNPFWDEIDNPIFATCSYDWTVRIWSTKNSSEPLICRSTEGDDILKHQVNDVCWSPKTSSVFSMVADDGRVEIWDLKLNNLAPMVCWFDKDAEGNKLHTPKTTCKFAKNLPVLLTGDTKGKVHVYRTSGLEHI
jgi:WD40 repeat protein